MDKTKELTRKTFIISIGKICTSFVTFLLLPLYTNILSTEEYGIVDLVNTLIGLIVPIASLQIEQAVLRNLISSKDDKEKQNSIISTAFFELTFQILMFVILSLIIFPYVGNNYKYLLLTNLIAYIYFSFSLQVARGLGQTQKYSLGSFLSAFFTIVFNIVFIAVFKLGATGMLLGNLCGYLCSLSYMFISLRVYKYINVKKFSKSLLKKLLRYSVPLVPNSLSWWVFTASDRIIVSSYLGVSENGIMSACLKFSTIIITLYNIFDTSWIESVSAHIDDSDFNDFYNSVFKRVFNFFACLCLLLICAMPFVFPIMINTKFSSGYGLIPISILATLFNTIQGMTAVVYAAKNNTKSIAKTSVTAAIVNIVIHLSLIKFIGLYAAVISTFASYFTLAIYRYYDVNKKYVKIKMDLKMLITVIILFILAFICYYINNVYIILGMIVLSIVYTLYSNKTVFKLIYKKILNRRN